MGNKSSKKIAFFVLFLYLIVSCKQSCFDVITHNNKGYWSRYWTEDDPYGVITEYSKKDSTVKNYCEDWRLCFVNSIGDIHGVKFRITNDTLFQYVNIKNSGLVIMWDTIPIVSYSKDTIVIRSDVPETVKWHRIPSKIVKKYKSSR